MGLGTVVGDQRPLGTTTCFVCPLRAISWGVSPIKTCTLPCLERILGHVVQVLDRVAPLACQWRVTAPSHERWLCARLQIPLSLIDTIPRTESRAEVGHF